jgi:hypothetical protein
MADLIIRISALLYQLLVGQISIQVALERLVSGLEPVAVEHQRYAIETIASNGTNTVIHPTYGNAALLAAIAALQSSIDGLPAEIVGDLTPVTLPDPAPSGYGGATAAAVWAWVLSNALEEPTTADYALTSIHAFLQSWQHQGAIPSADAPDFQVEPGEAWGYRWTTGYSAPNPDYADIRADDTVLSWLQRTDTSGHVWQLDANTGFAVSYTLVGSEYQYSIHCRLSDLDLPALRRRYAAPVWPGLANVTLGAPVALADELVVAGPLHGVLVDCSTPPPGASSWVLGDQEAYYRWGEVSFISDNGQVEPFQWLGFGLGVYTPKGMTEAASAIFRVSRLPTATVTPFVIT